MTQPRLYWLQAQQDPLEARPRLYWMQIVGNPVVLPPSDLESFALVNRTGTTFQLLATPGTVPGTSYEVQIESPAWAANWTTPSGAWAGALFNCTGATPATSYRARARAVTAGGVSNYALSEPFATDNTGSGTVEGSSPPPLTITATLDAFVAALSFTGPLGYRGDSLTTAGATGNCLLPLATLPAQNADLFRAELISTSFLANTLVVLTDGRFYVDPGTPDGIYSFTFRWYLNGVAQSPLVTRNVSIGPSGALSVNAALDSFTALFSFSVPVAPTLSISAVMEPFVSGIGMGTAPALSITAVMGAFTSIMPMVGDIAGVVPDVLSTARQYRVNRDVHLDAYSTQQGMALTWAKDPEALLDYSIDWADWLTDIDGDSLANMYVTSSDGVQVPAQAIRGAVAAMMVKGGEPGVIETVTVRIVTAYNRIDERTIRLLIQDR